jgi:hypothetical protein
LNARSFLKSHPEYQKVFPSFGDVLVSQLMKNGNFLAQAYTIAAWEIAHLGACRRKPLLLLVHPETKVASGC